jgi:hypothetical protein
MRTFVLKRQADLFGDRKTGEVAEGVVFESGKVVVEWLANHSIGIYDTVEKMLHVHCISGTAIEFRS